MSMQSRIAAAFLAALLAATSSTALWAQEATSEATSEATPSEAPAGEETTEDTAEEAEKVRIAVEPRGHSEAFLEMLQSDDEAVRTEAAEALTKGSLILERDAEAQNKIADQIKGLESLLGLPIGFERVEEERYGESLLRLVYVVKYQDAPILWEFFFYRPDGGWSLVNVNIQRGFGLLRGSS